MLNGMYCHKLPMVVHWVSHCSIKERERQWVRQKYTSWDIVKEGVLEGYWEGVSVSEGESRSIPVGSSVGCYRLAPNFLLQRLQPGTVFCYTREGESCPIPLLNQKWYHSMFLCTLFNLEDEPKFGQTISSCKSELHSIKFPDWIFIQKLTLENVWKWKAGPDVDHGVIQPKPAPVHGRRLWLQLCVHDVCPREKRVQSLDVSRRPEGRKLAADEFPLAHSNHHTSLSLLVPLGPEPLDEEQKAFGCQTPDPCLQLCHLWPQFIHWPGTVPRVHSVELQLDLPTCGLFQRSHGAQDRSCIVVT